VVTIAIPLKTGFNRSERCDEVISAVLFRDCEHKKHALAKLVLSRVEGNPSKWQFFRFLDSLFSSRFLKHPTSSPGF